MNPESVEPNWRLRVTKRDGTWRIFIRCNGESWGSIPMLFATAAEAWAFLPKLGT
jgi:hypothetical protein